MSNTKRAKRKTGYYTTTKTYPCHNVRTHPMPRATKGNLQRDRYTSYTVHARIGHPRNNIQSPSGLSRPNTSPQVLPSNRRYGLDEFSQKITNHHNRYTIPHPVPKTKIHVENQSAIDVALSQGKTKRRTHIDVKHHHLKHHKNPGSIDLRHSPGTDNASDALKKSLPDPTLTKNMKNPLTP